MSPRRTRRFFVTSGGLRLILADRHIIMNAGEVLYSTPAICIGPDPPTSSPRSLSRLSCHGRDQIDLRAAHNPGRPLTVSIRPAHGVTILDAPECAAHIPREVSVGE